ncbi:MAG: hypothetical protein JSU94_03135 [Phycisphaerales bacterium]|nr:MAG: hypothetical protein JSU94_03135 [Phycisphaerales bacterium]
MKVLVVFSNPPDQTPLRLDKEDKVIARLSRECGDSVEVVRQHASEIDDIHTLIIDGSFDIIHFSGHGSKEGIYLDKSDLSNEGELVSSRRLISLLALAEKTPMVALFLSCYSDENIEDLANAAPFVITSKGSVADTACILFTKGFYEWIFKEHSVQASYDHAIHLLKAKALPSESFILSRRSLIRYKNSIFVESAPKINKDSILINLDAVRNELSSFGMSEELLLHFLSRKLTIHYWIFDRARDNATIPIGRLLFGQFSWENAKDVVRCTKLIKLSPDVPREHWDLWSRFLISYNDLASCEYRSVSNPADPMNHHLLRQAVKLLQLYTRRYVQCAEPQFDRLGFGNLLPHAAFVETECDNAICQLELERYPQVVEALEGALTNYHEIVEGLQPPEEKR